MKTPPGFVLLALALTGCTSVSSAMPGMSPATGEAWYSKDTTLLGLPLDSSIYYCAKETPGKCTRAEWREGGASGARRGAPAAAASSAPGAPLDPHACEVARDFSARAAATLDEAPRQQLKRLAEKKAAECQALQNKPPAP